MPSEVHRHRRGPFETRCVRDRGPVLALHSQQAEIEYEKPKAPGGGQMSTSCRCHGPVPLSRADFFSAARRFWNSNSIKEIKSSIFSKALQPRSRLECLFIFSTPGGGQKSSAFRLRTGGQGKKLGRKIRRKFYFCPSFGAVSYGIPRGASKVYAFQSRTGGPAPRTFSRVAEIFFGGALKKNAAKFRVGGGD
jgi:hypothetical protein